MRSVTASTTRAEVRQGSSSAVGGHQRRPAKGGAASELVKQYDAFNRSRRSRKGQMTRAKTGDLGGWKSHTHYRRYVAAHGEPPVIGGLTSDQRFFISYGSSWKKRGRGSLPRQLLANDSRQVSKSAVIQQCGRLAQGLQYPAGPDYHQAPRGSCLPKAKKASLSPARAAPRRLCDPSVGRVR
jgi:hypothetical protein